MLDRMVAGDVPAKHHIAHRDREGTLRHEQCITRDGFDGPYTIVYHERRPHTQRKGARARHGWAAPALAAAAAERPLEKRHYRSQDLSPVGGAPIDARVPILFNADVVLSIAHPTAADPVYLQNGDGDELIYVHRGRGTLRSLLGDVRFEAEDYLYIPKGVGYRLIPDEGEEQYWLSMECLGGCHLPSQWRNPVGQLRMDAPYSHRDFRRPTFAGPRDEGIRELVVKRGHAFTSYAMEHSLLDAVGWDGSVYPFVFPIRNFQPRAGLVHLPPTWHGTFAARGALICSFVPRVVDFHEEAIPCPYPHASVDCDEFLFYAHGEFTSRRGVGPGSISYHPAGLAHGPHPGAYEASIGTRRTDELAVMLDTFRPLEPTDAALAVEDPNYHESFL
jgi:homogentisate 1,2-dioxygenase